MFLSAIVCVLTIDSRLFFTRIKPRTSLPASLYSYITLSGTLDGILISTASFPKAMIATTASVHMKPDIERLRKIYMDNPPERMTSRDIRRTSKDEVRDMDYFLNGEDPFGGEFKEEDFYIFIF